MYQAAFWRRSRQVLLVPTVTAFIFVEVVMPLFITSSNSLEIMDLPCTSFHIQDPRASSNQDKTTPVGIRLIFKYLFRVVVNHYER